MSELRGVFRFRSSLVIPRRSLRLRAPNVRLDGYQIDSVTPTDPLEPRSIKESRLSPAWPQWKAAIQKELLIDLEWHLEWAQTIVKGSSTSLSGWVDRTFQGSSRCIR